jgi:hypothetical protein
MCLIHESYDKRREKVYVLQRLCHAFSLVLCQWAISTNFGIWVHILVTKFIPSNFILVTKVRFLDFVLLVHIQGSQSMDFHFCPMDVFRFVVSHAECVLSGWWYQVTCLSPVDISRMFSTIIIIGKSVRKWIHFHSTHVSYSQLSYLQLVLYNLSSWQSLWKEHLLFFPPFHPLCHKISNVLRCCCVSIYKFSLIRVPILD